MATPTPAPGNKTPTAADLIDELIAESKSQTFAVLGLAIASGKSSKFVFAGGGREEMLEELKTAIRAGGEPVGFAGLVQMEDGCWGMYVHSLVEGVGNMQIEVFLAELGKTFFAHQMTAVAVEQASKWRN